MMVKRRDVFIEIEWPVPETIAQQVADYFDSAVISHTHDGRCQITAYRERPVVIDDLRDFLRWSIPWPDRNAVTAVVNMQDETPQGLTMGVSHKSSPVGSWLSNILQRSYDEIVNATETRS
jgi:hypothetical protein